MRVFRTGIWLNTLEGRRSRRVLAQCAWYRNIQSPEALIASLDNIRLLNKSLIFQTLVLKLMVKENSVPFLIIRNIFSYRWAKSSLYQEL